MTDPKQDIPPTPKAKKPKAKKSKGLTLKQQAFVDAYFGNSMNATMAWIELHPNVTYNSARAQSSLELTNLNVAAAIAKRLKEKAMGVDELIARYGDQARASLFPFIRITDEGFVFFDFSHPQAKEYMHIIKKIMSKRTRRIEDKEVWEDEWVQVELYDAQKAMEMIGKMQGLFVDRTDITSGGEKVNVMVYMPDNKRDE